MRLTDLIAKSVEDRLLAFQRFGSVERCLRVRRERFDRLPMLVKFAARCDQARRLWDLDETVCGELE